MFTRLTAIPAAVVVIVAFTWCGAALSAPGADTAAGQDAPARAGDEPKAASGPAEREVEVRKMLGANTMHFRWKGKTLEQAWEDWEMSTGGDYFVDREALEACAADVLGTHDFTAFTPTQTEHVRFERDVMRCEWRDGAGLGPEPVLELWIEADAFMRNMVRILAGTMLDVAGGRRPAADFPGLLAGAPRERAGETAPPHGLYLAAVAY